MRRVAAALAFAVLVGCGGGSAAESARRDQVDAIRTAAEAGDVEAARAAVEELRALVDGQLADGEVDPEEAARVLAAAGEVETALGPPPTQATTTTVAPTTTTAPPPPAQDRKDDGKDGGRGKDRKDGKRDD